MNEVQARKKFGFSCNLPILRLDEVVWFQEGPGIRKSQFVNKGIKLLNVANIEKNEINLSKSKNYISNDEAGGKYLHFLVETDDLVIASSGIKINNFDEKIAFIRMQHLPLCMNTSTIRFRSLDNSKLDIQYFSWFLRSDCFKKQVQFWVTGSAQLNFGPSHLKKMYVSMPCLKKQQEIFQTLGLADNLRQKRKEQLALLDDYLKSVFLEMFGDPVINPKKWPIKELGKVGDLDRGISKNRPRNAPELLGGPYPLIQTGDVSNSRGYIKEFKQTYSELGLMQSKMWPIGTLCITIAANIAKTGILTFEACFPDSVVGFTPNNLVRTEYVQWWMVFLQKMLEEKAPESAQKNINLGILRVLDIPVPPIELQNKFVLIIEQVEKTKQKMRDSLNEMDNHFNALMQRYFE